MEHQALFRPCTLKPPAERGTGFCVGWLFYFLISITKFQNRTWVIVIIKIINWRYLSVNFKSFVGAIFLFLILPLVICGL